MSEAEFAGVSQVADWKEWYASLAEALEGLGVDKATARIVASMTKQVKPTANISDIANFISKKVEELSKLKIPPWVIEDILKKIPRL